MSKNLEIVQKTAKVLGIISKVVYVLCIVGAVGSLVGLVALCFANSNPDFAVKIQQESEYTGRQLIGFCIIGLVNSIIWVVVSKSHRDYFMMEQNDGNPFTQEGAKAFRTLGIMNIVAPMIAVIATAILEAIFKVNTDIRPDAGFGLGVAMILISFVLAYGAELEEKKSADLEPKA